MAPYIPDLMEHMPENSQEILTEPENKLPEFTFDQLPPVMRESVEGMGWRRPMPVQAKAVPYLLADRDMIVQSRTGSGKTGAFLIPLLMKIDPGRRHPQALVLVPTRELAGQVYKEFQILGQGTGIEGALLYGGVGYNSQLQSLRAGAQMIIGTPGRVLDHIGRRSLNLDRLHILVFDEADEMLSMGFYPDMRELRRYLPRERSSWMFSATMPYKVQLLAREFLREPEFLSLSSGNVTVSTMEHRFYDVPPLEKDIMLMRLIELENPDSVIIFCNTKMEVEYLATVLRNYGYNADQLSGDLDQKSRERAMARIRNGETRFLVATDVAARGIDISDLSHVIQYDVPKDPDSYVHRAGRTARAGNTGVVITLISNMSEKSDLKKIARRYNVEFVELPVPTSEEVAQRMGERLTIALEDQFRTGVTRLERERMKRFLLLAKNLVESEDESMLLAMLLDRVHQDIFHKKPVPAPEPQPAPAPSRSEQPVARQQQPAPAQQRTEAAELPAEGDAERKRKKRRRKRKRNRGAGEGQPADAAAAEQQQPAPEPVETGAGTDQPATEQPRDERPAGTREATEPGEAKPSAKQPRGEERRGEGRPNERRDEGRRGEGREKDERRRNERERKNRSTPARNDDGVREITEPGDGLWMDSIQVIEPEGFIEPEMNVKQGGDRGRRMTKEESAAPSPEAAAPDVGDVPDVPAGEAQAAPEEPAAGAVESSAEAPATTTRRRAPGASKKSAAASADAASEVPAAKTKRTASKARTSAPSEAPSEETTPTKGRRTKASVEKGTGTDAGETAVKPAARKSARKPAVEEPDAPVPAPEKKRRTTKKAPASSEEPVPPKRGASKK